MKELVLKMIMKNNYLKLFHWFLPKPSPKVFEPLVSSVPGGLSGRTRFPGLSKWNLSIH